MSVQVHTNTYKRAHKHTQNEMKRILNVQNTAKAYNG